MDRLSLILGCSVFVFLGVLHFVLTIFTRKFEAREAQLTEDMKRVSPILTGRISMWKGWVGFHISHSLGLMVFGSFYIIVALENYAYLKSSVPLNVILLAVPLLYLVVAVKYWFDRPRNGILVGFTLIALSFVLRLRS